MSTRYTVTITWDMYKRLEEERKRRFLDSVPATIRWILTEYILTHPPSPPKEEPKPAES